MTDYTDLNSILTDRERLLMAAWTLPNEGALTDDQRQAAMHNFAQYTRLRGINNAAVGKQVGSPKATTIRDLVMGRYRKDADKHIRTLNNWVEQHARRQAATLAHGFVTTTHVARQMFTIARIVRENATMGLAVGPSGIGKTACAKALHDKYSGSICFRVIRDYRHAFGVIRALARQVGVTNPRSKALQELTRMERVLKTLEHTNRLIIVDEAHQLADSGIETLRDVHDETGCPILLVATKDLADRIRRNADPDHGQLYRRFDIIYSLVKGRQLHLGGDNKPLFTAEDITAMYNEQGVRLAGDAVDYLLDVANDLGRGSVGRCDILVRNAIKAAHRRLGVEDHEKVAVSSSDLIRVDKTLRPDATDEELIAVRLSRIGLRRSAKSA